LAAQALQAGPWRCALSATDPDMVSERFTIRGLSYLQAFFARISSNTDPGITRMSVALFTKSALRLAQAVATVSLLTLAPAQASDLEIILDRAQVFNIPVESKTLIIGNPAVADVSIIQPGLMVITGKSFGLTNLVSLDKDGRQIANSMLRVTATTEQMITIVRGGKNETLHCPEGGICASTITLGDNPEVFSAASGQSAARQAASTAGTPAPAPTR
jgi:hypothetical protein